MTANTAPTVFPVIAWCMLPNKRAHYVAQLPGDGGVDWGFTLTIGGTVWQGRAYDCALPLSKYHWYRFAKRQRIMGRPAYWAPA